jgi:hypothetical protein
LAHDLHKRRPMANVGRRSGGKKTKKTKGGEAVEGAGREPVAAAAPIPSGGRALLIGGATRTAPRTARTDWTIPFDALAVESLDPARRRALADYWTRVGALEHASVASFSRFSLQLLALGAPPRMLAGAQEAAMDEIEHARFAYGLASALAGEEIGPGPLDLRGLDVSTDVGHIVEHLVEEACVAETIGVIEAMTIAERAHPAVREAFGLIARDEAEHAALAWGALAWMVDNLGPEVGRIAVDALDFAVESSTYQTERVGLSAPELGVLDSIDRAAARAKALEEVIAPLREEIVRRVQRSAAAA